MNWTFEIKSGALINEYGTLIDHCLSGYGENANDSTKTNVSHLGPLPCGLYTIEPERNDVGHLGPVVMNLTPYPSNEMFGRSLFRIHGYSKDDPKTQTDESLLSSHGCICAKRETRQAVSKSPNRVLQVIDGLDSKLVAIYLNGRNVYSVA